ncbi:MAG: heavy metal translocating P-type ATPase, partial [Pseudomonadales bacterium]|nr:heavy metal translocating P-type ATPase [Pseudomonadales bacterium]
CALGLAVPAVTTAASGRLFQRGMLIKHETALERLAQVDTVIFDKTGTLTAGKPAVVAIEPAGSFDSEKLLFLAASLENQSEHPLALAIVEAAQARDIRLAEATEFDSPTGKGVIGRVEGRQVAMGAERYMSELKVDVAALQARAEAMRRDGATAIYVSVDNGVAGVIGIADPVKASTPAALAALRAQGLRLVMLTGDNRTTAEAVARKLGITEVEAEVLPEHKSEVIARLKSEGRVVAMAGDGVNDAPALAAADVGVAMGGGTDVAIESAGVTLLHGDLTGIVKALRMSRLTMRNIRQNLFFAFAYNSAGVPIAAGILYPFTGDLLSPMFAAAAMALSSVSVIANSLRLGSVKI